MHLFYLSRSLSAEGVFTPAAENTVLLQKDERQQSDIWEQANEKSACTAAAKKGKKVKPAKSAWEAISNRKIY